MDKCSYKLNGGTLYIYNCNGVKDFCCDSKTEISKFNMPVVLDENITDCTNMFRGCKSFNQPVKIPQGVINCYGMFMFCEKFDQPLTIPDSVQITSYMHYRNVSLSQKAENFRPKNDKFFLMYYGCTTLENQPAEVNCKGISVSDSILNIPLGETRMLKITLEPDSCTFRPVVSTDKPENVKTDIICFKEGSDFRCNITSLQKGNTTLTFTCDGLCATTEVRSE